MSPTACRLPPAAARRRPPPACYREGVRPSFIDVQAGWDGLGGQLLASTRSCYGPTTGPWQRRDASGNQSCRSRKSCWQAMHACDVRT